MKRNLFKAGIGILIVLVLSVCPKSLSAQQASLNKKIIPLSNPLINEPGMSDPHMLVQGDVCYIFTGHDIGVGISDWVMPDWRIYRSDDLQTWKHVGTINFNFFPYYCS